VQCPDFIYQALKFFDHLRPLSIDVQRNDCSQPCPSASVYQRWNPIMIPHTSQSPMKTCASKA
jgi:hypothetical protein